MPDLGVTAVPGEARRRISQNHYVRLRVVLGFCSGESQWLKQIHQSSGETVTRERLAELLNEDLSREYQAIIAYVVYSQVLKGAEYMDIADQLEIHAKQELDHALMISRQIDYLGAHADA